MAGSLLERTVAGSDYRDIFLEKGQKVYVISDMHFDHKNIIEYCNRPFESKEQMNGMMLKNWNEEVKPDDYVFCLGDVAHGKGSRSIGYWFMHLNGTKYLIKGGHDKKFGAIPFSRTYHVEYEDEDFLLIHDPRDIPQGWKGWVIHGHTHNNHMDTSPFIDGLQKRINVSVELIDYRPLDLAWLFELDFRNIEYMRTIESQPIRR